MGETQPEEQLKDQQHEQRARLNISPCNQCGYHRKRNQYERVTPIADDLVPQFRHSAPRALLLDSGKMIGAAPAIDLRIGEMRFSKNSRLFGEDGICGP